MRYFIIPEKMSLRESICYINLLDMTIEQIYKGEEENFALYEIRGQCKWLSEISIELKVIKEYNESKVLDKLYSTIFSKLKQFGKTKEISIYTEFGALNFKARMRR